MRTARRKKGSSPARKLAWYQWTWKAVARVPQWNLPSCCRARGRTWMIASSVARGKSGHSTNSNWWKSIILKSMSRNGSTHTWNATTKARRFQAVLPVYAYSRPLMFSRASTRLK